MTTALETAVRIACNDGDPEVFFGPIDSPVNGKLHAWEAKALAICARCLIQMRCLAEALRYPVSEQHGVVGGMTASQRRALMLAGRQKSGLAA
jgi:Transcription factor WhiB